MKNHRRLGWIVLAVAGIVLALLGVSSGAANTLLSLALNGFVIYALGTSRSSFSPAARTPGRSPACRSR